MSVYLSSDDSASPERTEIAGAGVDQERVQRLVAALAAALPAERVLDAPADRLRVAGDLLRGARARQLRPSAGAQAQAALPLVVVRPASSSEVSSVLRVATELRVPVVEFGGGTGLMGGARTIAPGIVLDLRSLNRVIEVSARDRTVHVQAGAVLADVAAALLPHGLILGHDPWTFPIATVGGTISTNGLGYLGGRYGSMGDQVLGLTVVLADGSRLQTRPALRSSTGPRLRALFAGAEGTLGVIVEAVLRVFPQPEAQHLAAFEFAGFDEGFVAVEALAAAGIQPAMVDFGQSRDWQDAADNSSTPDGRPGLLNLAFHGLREEVAAVAQRATAVLLAAGGRQLPQQRATQFWQSRHVDAAEIRARQEAGDAGAPWPPEGLLFDFMHVALPPSRVLDFKRRCQDTLLAHGTSIAEWGLWNGPELFSIAVFRRGGSETDVRQFAESIDAALRLAQDCGGSMEYCHGAGLRLAHLMEREHGTGLAALRGIKHVLDPAGILNPGKLGL